MTPDEAKNVLDQLPPDMGMIELLDALEWKIKEEIKEETHPAVIGLLENVASYLSNASFDYYVSLK